MLSQHCRHEFFWDVIGSGCDEVSSTGAALALSEMNIKFVSPLTTRENFRVTARMNKMSGVRIVFDQVSQFARRQHQQNAELIARHREQTSDR